MSLLPGRQTRLELCVSLSVHQEIQTSLVRRPIRFIDLFLCKCLFFCLIGSEGSEGCCVACVHGSNFTPSLLVFLGKFSGLGHTVNCCSYKISIPWWTDGREILLSDLPASIIGCDCDVVTNGCIASVVWRRRSPRVLRY